MQRYLDRFLHIVRDRFNLSNQQEDKEQIIISIESGVEFRGINVWTLVFAIFIASIGLNVNSTAVVIGAMLISPLMGPIMGLGLSVSIFDFVLLKRSLKNLSIAVFISVITSTLYFIISPLNDVQSELLSRTTPTIYDVLIALFGGFAGIMAGTTKEKGNSIPGVAIATALMPPLCTAGFGLATGNILYFLGAFYLFFINAVMISLSTFLTVKFLKFPPKQNIDEKQNSKVKKYIILIVTITVLPSIYLAYQIINQSIFKNNVNEFIAKEMNFDHTPIINKTIEFSKSDSNSIIVYLAGQTLDKSRIIELKNRLKYYSINSTKLIIKQGIENIANVDVRQIKTGIIEEIYKKNENTLKNKDEKIVLLENEILNLKALQYPTKQLCEEINAINPLINSFSVTHSEIYNLINSEMDTTLLVFLKAKRKIGNRDKEQLHKWLQKRLDFENINIYIQ